MLFLIQRSWIPQGKSEVWLNHRWTCQEDDLKSDDCPEGQEDDEAIQAMIAEISTLEETDAKAPDQMQDEKDMGGENL